MTIKMLILDVDGTMTDGSITLSSNGVETKSFNVKDGYGIKKAISSGMVVSIITGRESECVNKRAEELGIIELYQGVQCKSLILQSLIDKYSIDRSEVAYFGDDINDLECMAMCSLTGSPKDATPEILDAVDFISQYNGGHGAVRDFIEYIIKKNNQ